MIKVKPLRLVELLLQGIILPKTGQTAYNKRYTLPAGQARLQGFRSPRSLRSHGSLHPHFANPGLASQALIRVCKTSYT